MPYRADGRTAPERSARLAELSAALKRAQLRVQAAAGKLKALERQLEAEGRALDVRVASAEDAKRRATLLSLASTSPDRDQGHHIRGALHTQGVVNALERAMSGAKRPRKVDEPKELESLERAREALHEAREQRAWLASRREPSLGRARARLADAVTAYDEAMDAHRAFADSMAP